MASLDPAETARRLISKFGFENTGGGNHDRYKLVIGNTFVASVDLARHKEPYRDKLIGYMAGQLKVPAAIFKGMIQCSVDNAAFLALKGVSPPAAVQSATTSQPPQRQIPAAQRQLPPSPQP